MSDYASLNTSIKRSPIHLEPLDIDGPSVVLQASDRIDQLNAFIRKNYTDRQIIDRLKTAERQRDQLQEAMAELLRYIGALEPADPSDPETLVGEVNSFLEL